MDDAPALLIVEDDAAFARALRRSFERHGFTVHVADGPGTLLPLPEGFAPGFAVVDLKLAGGSGLECVRLLHAHAPAMRIVVLTGYASIATAVEAIKLGARHYLPKPANTDDILAAFMREAGDPMVAPQGRPTSIKSLEWERIHETLAETGFNISEAARRLGMHRRTLARKLDKRGIT